MRLNAKVRSYLVIIFKNNFMFSKKEKEKENMFGN